jgi:hypothetical protein
LRNSGIEYRYSASEQTENAAHQHIADPAASSIHYPSTHLKSLTLTVLIQAHKKRPIFYPTDTSKVNKHHAISKNSDKCRPPANPPP